MTLASGEMIEVVDGGENGEVKRLRMKRGLVEGLGWLVRWGAESNTEAQGAVSTFRRSGLQGPTTLSFSLSTACRSISTFHARISPQTAQLRHPHHCPGLHFDRYGSKKEQCKQIVGSDTLRSESLREAKWR